MIKKRYPHEIGAISKYVPIIQLYLEIFAQVSLCFFKILQLLNSYTFSHLQPYKQKNSNAIKEQDSKIMNHDSTSIFIVRLLFRLKAVMFYT